MKLNRHGLPIIEPTGRAGKRTKRIRMHARDPFCFWCGRRTVLELDPPTRKDLATIDHLYSRLHPLRQMPRGNDRTELLHVLACRECNHARSVADQQGRIFEPKLKHRQRIAFETSASIGVQAVAKAVKEVAGRYMTTIETIEEAVAFARDEL